MTVNGEKVEISLNEDGTVTFCKTLTAKEKELITEEEIKVNKPVEGEKLYSYPYGEYSYRDISWDPMPEDGKAVAGESYTATVVMTPYDGYKFDETTSVTVNGEKVEISLNEDGTVTFCKTLTAKEKELITEEEIKVNKPVEGEKLYSYPYGEYSYRDISWDPMPEDGKAVAGESYTATVVMTPYDGYKFDETTSVTVNGEKVEISLNEDGTVTFCKTFTAKKSTTIPIEEASVSEIENMVYTGSEQKPSSESIVVSYDGEELTENKDYEVSYPDKDYTSVGEKKIVITGIGQYEGSKTVSYQITKGSFKADPDSDKVIVKDYDGKALENPTVYYYNKDTDTKTKLSEEDYTITWILYSDENGDKVIDRSKTKDPGIYYYTLKGKGKYEGQVEDYASMLYRVKDTYTGLKNVDGTWYYYVNGEVDRSYSNLVNYNGGWYYVHNGKIDWSYSTLAQVNGKGAWYYVKNGKLDRSYTGLAQNEHGWFYVQKGVVNFDYSGLVSHNGGWYYVEKGCLNGNYSNLVKYNGNWYYVHNGKIDWSYSTLAQVNGKGAWYCVKNGKIDWSYSGLAQNEYGWFYVKSGVVDFSYTGLCRHGNSWFYVQKGALNWNYTGLCQYGGAWYYVQKGVLNWNYTGLAQVNGKGAWYYVQKGVLNWNYTGLAQVNGKGAWYYVQKGVLNWNYTGLCAYGGRTWYVKNGTVDFSFSGSYAGKKIVSGMVK